MSLGTLFFGFVPVAAVFVVAGWWANGRRLTRPAALVLTAEALTLTLLAALWFGSLGSGGWFLVFLLLGILVSGAERGLRFAMLRSAGSEELKRLVVGVVKYLLAGAVLAWRLG